LNEDGISNNDFSNREAYSNLEYLLIYLRRLIIKDKRVLVGYYSIFSKIILYLRDGRLPTLIVVDWQIRESWRDREVKLFLDTRGKLRYMLEYLINFVEELILKQKEVIFADDRYLLIYINDSYYSLLREKLYKN